jgi:hypothetical protein
MTKQQLTDNDVINFLTQNTGFFVRHPEQLEALKVSNKNGSVATLVNHQVNVLKERNNQLKSKLTQLIKFAEENEKIMAQVFELSLQLCQISHVANVTKHFGRFVKHSFDSDLFRMVLPANANLESSATVLCITDENKSKFQTIFSEFQANSQPLCGRLKQEKLKFIFPQQADKIGSSVILPIGDHAQKGLLVFASFDESRFNPDMSTDLLSKLSQILDRKFNQTFDVPSPKKAQK